jgi:hypothetical protein
MDVGRMKSDDDEMVVGKQPLTRATRRSSSSRRRVHVFILNVDHPASKAFSVSSRKSGFDFLNSFPTSKPQVQLGRSAALGERERRTVNQVHRQKKMSDSLRLKQLATANSTAEIRRVRELFFS